MPAVIRMPEVATGAAEAAIQSWLVSVGETVAKGQAIVEIETEKAVVEYEAEAEGVVAGLLLPEGQAAAVGVPIAVLATAGESAAQALDAARGEGVGSGAQDAAAPAAADVQVPATGSPSESTSAPADLSAAEPTPADTVLAPASEVGGAAPSGLTANDSSPRRLFASPLVRRLAKERGIDLAQIAGTGPHGRIVRRDLDSLHAPEPAAPAPTALPSQPAELSQSAVLSQPARTAEPATTAALAADRDFEDIPHTGMRRAIARRLTESKSTVPHFYVTADCRVDELIALRERVNASGGAKVSVNDFVVKAVACALQDVPEANAIWTDEATRRYARADIAVAVSVPSGLLTPVVRGVETLSLGALSTQIKELAGRAREGRLKQHELEGGSFSVSNLGMYGTQEFSAIINPPHAGILAVGAASRRPVIDDAGELGVATVMTVTLSADHRVLDGAVAAQWLSAFVNRIENPFSLLV